MQYRQAGTSGLRLSCLGLGSFFTIGDAVAEESSKAMIRCAYDNGINFFDTANAYGDGAAETLLGQQLKDYRRSSLVVLTKVHASMGKDPNEGGLSYKAIVEQTEACLKRLQMDYVDVLMFHRPDPTVPLEEQVRAVEDLIRRGKVLYWAVSEWAAADMVAANAIARQIGARPMTLSEPRYNLLYRYPERELFPWTRSEGIGNVTFSPLAHGMLSAKYQPGKPPPEGTRAADPVRGTYIKQLYWSQENMQSAQELERIAQELGATAAQVAIAWCLTRSDVSSVIMGATRMQQLEDNLRAADLVLPPEVIERIETLYPLHDAIPRITQHH